MSLTFYIGQRVRCAGPESSPLTGKEATIWGTETNNVAQIDMLHGVSPDETLYLLDVDGLGRYWSHRNKIGAPARWLRPLTPPEQKTTWAECPWAPDKIREQVSA